MVNQDTFRPFVEWTASLREYVPNLAAAALLIVLGWLLARLVRALSRRIAESSLKRLEQRSTVREALEHSGVRSSAPKFVSVFLFWLVWLFFVAAAAEALGLPVVTTSLNRFAYYLPNVLAAVLILFAGMVAGNVLGNILAAAADRAGIARAPLVGTVTQTTILLVAVIVALEQLGVNGDVLIIVASVVIGGLLTTGGLAFGLGARAAVSNLIASHYVARAYQLGQTVRIDGVEGSITDITTTAVVLQTPNGTVYMPAHRFLEVMSTLVGVQGSATESRTPA